VGLIEILWASSSAAFCEAAVPLSAWWAYLMLRKIIAVADERDIVIIQTPRKVSNHNVKYFMNHNTPIPSQFTKSDSNLQDALGLSGGMAHDMDI
jgi:hypothetical protein